MINEIMNLVYPRRCAICGKIATPSGAYIHSSCKDSITWIQEPRCVRCGKPVEQEEQEYCFDCSKKNFHYIRGFSLFRYDKIMSKSIAEFKYKGKKEYADFYVSELVNAFADEILKISPDVIIPIPIHSSKLLERGFNQAKILADGIGKALRIPVDNQILIRNKKTLPQKQLNDKERLKNLEQAFEVNQGYDTYGINTVILIDDIYTTGSTIESCTKILNQVGIPNVYYISVCIGQGY